MKVKALLIILITVLVISTITTPAYAADEQIEDGDRYWVGQDLQYEVDSDSSDAELYVDDSDVNVPFITELDIDDDGNINITTDGYDENPYRLEYNDEFDNNEQVKFNLTEQTFDINYSSSEVSNEVDTEIDLEYNSNRNNYDINVSSDDLDDDQLSNIFGYDKEDVEDNKLKITSSDDVADFKDISSGSYDIKYNVTDTDAVDSEEIEVISGDSDETLKFNKSVYNVDRGSEVHIKLDFTGINSSNIEIGGENVGYEIDFDVTDSEDNGEVTFVFDTYEAGLNNSEDVVEIQDDSEGDISVNSETEIDVERLEALDYDITGYVDNIPVEFGTISVNEGNINSINTYSYPSDEVIDDIDEIESASESDTIAENDTLIVEINGNIHSFIDEDTNLDNSTDELNGFYFNILSRSPNSDNYVKLNNSDIYTEPSDSETYIVAQVNSSRFEIGDKHTIETGLNQDNEYIEDKEDEIEIEKDIDIVERETTFNDFNTQEDRIEIDEDGIVSADTNLADQTERVLVIKKQDEDPDIHNYDVTALNGKFTANISDNTDIDDEFTVEIIDETDTVDGVIVESDEENEDENNEESDAIQKPGDNNDGNEDENGNNTDKNNTGDYNDTEPRENEDSGGIIDSIISFFKSIF